VLLISEARITQPNITSLVIAVVPHTIILQAPSFRHGFSRNPELISETTQTGILKIMSTQTQ